jgi:DDE superfamily endonuclease
VSSELTGEISKKEGEAMDFTDEAIKKFMDPKYIQDYILNMDETGIEYYSARSTTLANRGDRHVTVSLPKIAGNRVSIAVTITASDKMLPSMLIFRGTPGYGPDLEVCEFPGKSICVVQGKNYMDELRMLIWMQTVLKPYVDTHPPGIQPVLLLDNVSCHKTDLVMAKLNELRVEMMLLPTRCTQWVQPLDVGVNGPIKVHYRKFCHKWKMQDVAAGRVPVITRELVARWCNQAFDAISADVIKNCWRSQIYPYF